MEPRAKRRGKKNRSTALRQRDTRGHVRDEQHREVVCVELQGSLSKIPQ